jgi:hypothetical protein
MLKLDATTFVPGHGPVFHNDAHVRLIRELMRAIVTRVDIAMDTGKPLEVARTDIHLEDLRAQFAVGSALKASLFDAYVAGPAVTNAWQVGTSSQR